MPTTRQSLNDGKPPQTPSLQLVDQERIRIHSATPWMDLRNKVLSLLERLEIEQAQTLIRELQYVNNLPPHGPAFLKEMEEFSEDLSRFRSELFVAGRRPLGTAVIAIADLGGQLTLITVDNQRLVFQNSDRAQVNLSTSELEHFHIVNLAQQLASAGGRLNSLDDYRRFIRRVDEIRNTPPPLGAVVPSGRQSGNSLDGRRDGPRPGTSAPR